MNLRGYTSRGSPSSRSFSHRIQSGGTSVVSASSSSTRTAAQVTPSAAIHAFTGISIVTECPHLARSRYLLKTSGFWSDWVGSKMDCAIVNRQGGFVHGFRQRRMGVHRARQVFRAGAEFHRGDDFGDQLGRLRAQDMRAQDTIGFRVSKDFDAAPGLANTACATVRDEWESAGTIFNALLRELLLAFPYPRDLGPCVYDPRNRRVIHVPGLTGDALGHCHTFFRALVRQHGAAHYVPDCIHILQVGAAVLIDFYKSAGIELEPRSLRIESLGVRFAADRHDELVHFQRIVCVTDLEVD